VRIEQLEIEGFRNLSGVRLGFSPSFNVFTGDNGVGKTNLIEAIYFVGRLRSFRAARLESLVAHGRERALLAARVVWPGLSSTVEIELSVKGKRVRVDGKGIGRIADHCSQFRMVLFTPADVDLPRGAPLLRRRFLDRAIFNRHPGFLAEAMALDEVLRQRNALLRERSSAPGPALLLPYDRQLAAIGARLACARREFTSSVRARFAAILEELLGAGPPGDLHYRSTLPGVDAGAPPERVAEQYLEELQRLRPRDLAQRATSCGPHRDDLEMLLDGRPLREHASQGQHRVFVLALKITEIETLLMLGGARPVLLLDDISSELDARRNEQLFTYLSRVHSQVFITTTAADQVRIPGESGERLDFVVRGGRIGTLRH